MTLITTFQVSQLIHKVYRTSPFFPHHQDTATKVLILVGIQQKTLTLHRFNCINRMLTESIDITM